MNYKLVVVNVTSPFLLNSFSRLYHSFFTGKRIKTNPISLDFPRDFRLVFIISYGHMAASVLASSGEATPKQIQEFMGHDDISITYGVYVQSAKDSGKKTSAAMSKALAGLMETPAACSEICSELRFG